MNTVRRIAKNTGVLLISQIASYILGFFFIMYTARYLGAEGFGILSFALAFTAIFGEISFVMAIVTCFILIADVGQLSEKVKWQPKFDLDTGLEQTITWWKKYVCV